MAKKKNEISIRSSDAEYLIYVASVGNQADSFEMRYEDENIWLTQKMMATLYDVSVSAINQHLKKIFDKSDCKRLYHSGLDNGCRPSKEGYDVHR